MRECLVTQVASSNIEIEARRLNVPVIFSRTQI